MRHFSSSPPSRHAFTLIELLVVISIIALLVSMLLPSLTAARVEAQKVVCRGNHRQMSVGTMAFVTDYKQRLPMTSYRYFDLMEPGTQYFAKIDTEMAGYFRDYLGIAIVAGTNNDINFVSGRSNVLRCPGANLFPTNTASRIFQYNTINYRLDGLDSIDYLNGGSGASLASVTANRSIFLSRNAEKVRFPTLTSLAQEVCQIYPQPSPDNPAWATEMVNNHNNTGLNLTTFDGSGRWIPKSQTISANTMGGYMGFNDGGRFWNISNANLNTVIASAYASACGSTTYVPWQGGPALAGKGPYDDGGGTPTNQLFFTFNQSNGYVNNSWNGYYRRAYKDLGFIYQPPW